MVCLSIHADHGHRIHIPSPRVHLGRGSFCKLLFVAAFNTFLVLLVVAVATPFALLCRLFWGLLLRTGGPSLPGAAAAAAAPLVGDTRLPLGPVAPAALLFLRLTADHFTVLLRFSKRVAGQESLHLSGHFPPPSFFPPQDYQSSPRPEFAFNFKEM